MIDPEPTPPPFPPPLPRIDTVPLADWTVALDRMEAGGARKQVLVVGG